MIDSRFIVISGLPGSGKTTLGRQLAQVMNLKAGRIQFTVEPDPGGGCGSSEG